METLLYLFSRLPMSWMRAIGRTVGVLIYKSSASYRERIHENLRYAGIDSEEMALRVAAEQGVQGIEAPWVWGRGRQDYLKQTDVSAEDEAKLRQAIEGRAVVFLTPHIGCYEVAPSWFAEKVLKGTDKNIAILYRVPRKSYLRKLVGEGRQTPNVLPCSADLKGVRQILRTLKSGGMAGILPDQVPSNGEGVWAPFFGKQAYTMTFPLRLIRQFKAVVVMARSERTPEGWRVYWKLWDEELTGDDAQDAALMNRLIEETVLECPHQYLWSYNRYKCPSGVQKPE
ncbi:MAG: lysophospholipid acyltransferase family protein [Burkholderiaceae bacterium]|nr:lysophospholipid acyltransferase family protein [Burkholderiaceae bacterium]